jgi:hypothetical protein
MKVILALALVACAQATPQYWYSGYPFYSAPAVYHPTTYAAPAVTYSAPVIAAPAAVPQVTKTQYHAQDELGQASYGYAHPGQAHAAVRDAFGNVRGSYAYVGADGKEVRTNYVADHNGFRVESNALPVGPAVPPAPVLVGPAPVVDTPEVAEARAAHFKAIEEAKARNAEADKKDAAEGSNAEETKDNNKGDAAEVLEAPKADEAKKSRRRRAVVYPTLTYSAPVVTYSAAVPTAVVAAAPAFRTATLTKVVNTPGHAVSYRVD